MDITNSAINSIGVDKDTLFTSSDTYIIKMEYSPGREQARQRAFIGNNTSLLKLVTASGAHWFATISQTEFACGIRKL